VFSAVSCRCRETHVAIDSSMAEQLIVYRTSLSGSGNHVSLDFLSRQALPRPANRKHPKRTERNVRRYWSDRDDHYTYCIVVSLAPARHPPTHFVADGRRSLFVHTKREVHNIRATTERAIGYITTRRFVVYAVRVCLVSLGVLQNPSSSCVLKKKTLFFDHSPSSDTRLAVRTLRTLLASPTYPGHARANGPSTTSAGSIHFVSYNILHVSQ